jgi:hypothetical protein
VLALADVPWYAAVATAALTRIGAPDGAVVLAALPGPLALAVPAAARAQVEQLLGRMDDLPRRRALTEVLQYRSLSDAMTEDFR